MNSASNENLSPPNQTNSSEADVQMSNNQEMEEAVDVEEESGSGQTETKQPTVMETRSDNKPSKSSKSKTLTYIKPLVL